MDYFTAAVRDCFTEKRIETNVASIRTCNARTRVARRLIIEISDARLWSTRARATRARARAPRCGAFMRARRIRRNLHNANEDAARAGAPARRRRCRDDDDTSPPIRQDLTASIGFPSESKCSRDAGAEKSGALSRDLVLNIKSKLK